MIERLADLFVQFSLLNFVAFGGITAMLPEIHRLAVDQRHWMDDATFAHLFAIAQAAPGPNLLVVSLIGWQVAGIPGGIAATVGICLPVSSFVYLLYRHWEKFRGTPWQQAIDTAIAPLAVGLVATSGYFVVTSAALDHRGLVVTALSTALLARTRWHPLWFLAAGGLAGGLGWL